MATSIKADGFACYDNTQGTINRIWGVGATEEEARTEARSSLGEAGIQIIADDEEAEDWNPSWLREGSMGVLRATKALIERVRKDSGDIAWTMRDHVACTSEEADDFDDNEEDA
jgi:hypothetical protein